MATKKTAPFGTWTSPITADAITQGSIKFDSVIVDPITSVIYHTEGRSSGRNALVETRTNKDVVAGEWNVRSGVQEYGGGAAAAYNGVIYFSNFTDGRVYKVSNGGTPEAVTPESSVHRFSKFAVHPGHMTLIVAILEDHTHLTPSQVATSLCVIDTNSKTVSPLIQGADFYSDPTFSPDGTYLAWQEWFHPDMPWEGGLVSVAPVTVKDGTLILDNANTHTIGTKSQVSASYPAWASATTLALTTDTSGYQNSWIYSTLTGKFSPVLTEPLPEDFGAPAWQLGMAYYTVLDSTSETPTALFTAYRGGRSIFYLLELKEGSTVRRVEAPFADVSHLRSLPDSQVVFVGVYPDQPSAIVLARLDAAPTYEKLKSSATGSSGHDFPDGIISPPQPRTIQVSSDDSFADTRPVHVVYYAPQNPDYSGSSIPGERPPCILNAHGGPTGMAGQGLSWMQQFFTSRGFAWLDVNYGGSSGYGREYISRLAGKWGLVDVSDCIQAAEALSGELIDRKRVLIRGGSAGGFTTLAALANAPNNTFFAAGTSLYGISNLELLAKDTHKFESRYMEKLMGGTIDEIPEVYTDRSPVTHADRIVSPLLILQGTEDKVVPPEQADRIYKAITEHGGVCELKYYEGEGHGWRRAENIQDALERELAFYVEILKLGA